MSPKLKQEYIDGITVRLCNLDDIFRLSRADYLENYESYPKTKKQRQKIAVNYIRHNMTNYDDLINEATFIDESLYSSLKVAFLDKIKQVYPVLSDACSRQINRNTYFNQG